jgi:ATP phosphoribosyltransferase
MRIAIPKGRLQSNALATFAAAGFQVPDASDLASRRLVFFRGGIEWIFVKDGDVPVYVEHGAADAGIAGFDQIAEQGFSACQPVEFGWGRCRMMLIGAPGAPKLSRQAPVKIATKYPRISRRYLDGAGIPGEIVGLAGSVELAAVLRLTSHVIDLVETGETARIHRLELQETVCEIAPRLIVSRNTYRTRNREIRQLVSRIEEASNAVDPGCVA